MIMVQILPGRRVSITAEDIGLSRTLSSGPNSVQPRAGKIVAMPNETADALVERKATLRRQAYDGRNAQPNKEEISRAIIERFLALAEYATAKTAMWYVDARSEVRTRFHLAE